MLSVSESIGIGIGNRVLAVAKGVRDEQTRRPIEQLMCPTMLHAGATRKSRHILS